jgi:hypothetical protein
MCFGKSQKAQEPAAAPAPPLKAPEEPEIAESRRKETLENFGQDAPSYRVSRSEGSKSVNPDDPIVM